MQFSPITRLGLCLAALGLASSCSIVAKVKGGGSGTPTTTSSPGAPSPGPSTGAASSSPHADEDMPQDVRFVANKLDELDGMIKKHSFERYAAVSSKAWQSVYEPDEDAVKRYGKLAALKDRLRAQDQQVVAMAGDNAKRIYGDGHRVHTARAEAIEEVGKALNVCQHADKMGGAYAAGETHATRFRDNVKKYLDQLARAEKIDPTITSFLGDVGAMTTDVKLALVVCELNIAEARFEFEDEYVEEVVQIETKKGCGKTQFSAGGVAIGGGQFAPYERMPGSTVGGEKVPCKAIPKANRIGSQFRNAAAQFKEHEQYKNAVFVETGKPYVEENQDDGRLYRYQDIVAYSPEMPFLINPCKGDDKTVCEASGSKSIAIYNRMAHHAARAELHHKAGRGELCKAQLKSAWSEWERFKKMFDEGKKDKSWAEGLKYKVRGSNEALAEKDFVKKFETESKAIDDHVVADWCNKP